jgi:hypothetical protein
LLWVKLLGASRHFHSPPIQTRNFRYGETMIPNSTIVMARKLRFYCHHCKMIELPSNRSIRFCPGIDMSQSFGLVSCDRKLERISIYWNPDGRFDPIVSSMLSAKWDRVRKCRIIHHHYRQCVLDTLMACISFAQPAFLPLFTHNYLTMFLYNFSTNHSSRNASNLAPSIRL